MELRDRNDLKNRKLRENGTGNRQLRKSKFRLNVIVISIGLVLLVSAVVLVIFIYMNSRKSQTSPSTTTAALFSADESDDNDWDTITTLTRTTTPYYQRSTFTADESDDDDWDAITTLTRTTTPYYQRSTFTFRTYSFRFTTRSTTLTRTRRRTFNDDYDDYIFVNRITQDSSDEYDVFLTNLTTFSYSTQLVREASTTLTWPMLNSSVSSSSSSADYFKYNETQKFRKLPGYDEHQELVVLPRQKEIHLVNGSFRSFFIHVNGYVSVWDLRGSIGIAPFDSDIDTRVNGLISHAEIDQADQLQAIAADINKVCPDLKFQPDWAHLVTWYQVRPYWYRNGDSQFGSRSDSKNTFQLVLTTQGNQTFAIFNYIELNWPNLAFPVPFEARVSYYFNTQNKGVYFSSKNKTLLVTSSNFNQTGRWIFTFNNTRCLF